MTIGKDTKRLFLIKLLEWHRKHRDRLEERIAEHRDMVTRLEMILEVNRKKGKRPRSSGG